MILRQVLHFAVFSGIVLASSVTAYAAKSHDGKIVSVTEGSGTTDGKLVMTDEQGKNEHSHAISSSVKITRNDKTAKLGDLKKGDAITVTTADDGKVTVLAATAPNSAGGSGSGTTSGDAEIPDILKNLKLSSDQEAKIKDIVSRSDEECRTAWKEFTDRYQQAIRVEAAMLATIEEKFSDGQRKRLRDQRRRAADRHNHSNERDNSKADRTAADNAVQEEFVIIGISLTPEQQESVQQVRNGYLQRLGRLNEDIEELHARMISLETEKILDIEDVLTKEQRQQLREDHQKLSRQSDETSNKSSAK